ncbi:LysR family transcriptional regulator, partial [Tabrizicola sp.]|uniref:LysR family transcriptional regulator n=1 Tax=Tabrizicola sp. TaxID=2005166 RepID=UPI0035B463F4
MGVTPGAVSQQIRLLGDRIGQPLFTRSREGVVLTGAGAVVHPALLSAFDQITRSMA